MRDQTNALSFKCSSRKLLFNNLWVNFEIQIFSLTIVRPKSLDENIFNDHRALPKQGLIAVPFKNAQSSHKVNCSCIMKIYCALD